MFWDRAHYALILMIELAQLHKKEGVEILDISEKYNLPISAFDGIIESLEESGYIAGIDGQLSLQIAADKISIWDIIESVDRDKPNEIESQTDRQIPQISTAIMVNKEMEVVLNMIQNRFKRHKLSAWSEKASKTVYI